MEFFTLALPPICWGIYGQLRKHFSPSIDTVNFTAIYVVGQLMFSIVIWICYGMYLDLEVDGWNAAIVFLGGFSVLYAEYFFLASADRMSTSTASAIFCLLSAIIGIPLDFLVEGGMRVNGALLFLGTALILSGLIIIILAEGLIPADFRTEKSFLAPRSVYCGSGRYLQAEDTEPSTAPPRREYYEFITGNHTSSRSAAESTMLVGCVLGILGGVFNSVWSVLGAFAGGRPNPFTSPATLLLVFDAGQLAALPFVFLIFGYYDVLGSKPSAERDAGVGSAWASLLRTPPAELLWAVAIGAIVGAGYWGYFASTLGLASQPAVPASIAYALVFCDMLVSLYASVFVFGDYGDWRSIAAGGPLWLVLVSGTACYVAGIALLALLLA